MDVVARLLLRCLLVPLGYVVGIVAGSIVLLVGLSHLREPLVDANFIDRLFDIVNGLMDGSLTFAALVAAMWLPAAIGILIAESFAVRSWVFHALNGAASAWIGWRLLGGADALQLRSDAPLAVTAAGLAGGFAYWAVAGWSAGFWKPATRRPTMPAPPHTTVRH
jgi:hypothetical protein